MLAPQHKLWTTPPAAVTAGLGMLQLTAADTLVDYGCGDGRALVEAASTVQCACIGYEINLDRANATQKTVSGEGLEGNITIKCQNALEAGESCGNRPPRHP